MNRSASKSSWFKKAAIGTAVVAMAAVGGLSTVSAFSDSATSNVTVTAGSIGLKAGGSDTFNVAIPEVNKPGATVTKQIVLTNTGTIPLTYTANTVAPTLNTLAAALDVTVTGGTPAAAIGTTSKLNAFKITTPRTIAAGGTDTLNVTFTWPSGNTAAVDNALQGKLGDSVITFTAAAA